METYFSMGRWFVFVSKKSYFCIFRRTTMNFYFYQDGNRKGPCSSAQIRTLAKHGTITPETIIETEEGKRSLASEVHGLDFSFTSSPFEIPSPQVMPHTQLPDPQLLQQAVIPQPVSFDAKPEQTNVSRKISKPRLLNNNFDFFVLAAFVNIVSWICIIITGLAAADSWYIIFSAWEERDLGAGLAGAFSKPLAIYLTIAFLVELIVFPFLVRFIKLCGKFELWLDENS